jgi:hypothetical protein
MRKGGGKQKGASFERSVCKQLSLWMSHGTREDLYWRSAMSGGRATVAARKGTRLTAQAGDITAIDPEGEPLTRQFLLECKHYKNLQFSGLLNGTGELSKFWKKLKDDSDSYLKRPLLIARQNSYPTIAVMDWTGLVILGLHADLCLTAPRLDFYAVPFDALVVSGKRP